MEKEKATIYDYARICRSYDNCANCPLRAPNNGENIPCGYLIRTFPDKADEIILKWCKEHPIETRQDRFLKIFPNAQVTSDGLLALCPQWCDKDSCNIEEVNCTDCVKEYWLEEVEENE